ncbi:uncharacterized protein LAJ45_05173 [Morchella importuna]|uniref:uncharacterized protein n=1 Tax=Morchella importuna TaxID=1174673 RepID=UPI001E8EA922|nr:uncharacterized protein LAJ45_05173 [Morchella importuna]KAH8150990.1 hypothetical protein LAJ45_05173 [Morchella importuna]
MGRGKDKKQNDSLLDIESRAAAAVRDYKAGKFRNIRDAATAYDLTYGKLRNRLVASGIGPKGIAQVDQQIITLWEEKAIVRRIVQLDDWGFPPRMKYVKDMATSFLRSHHPEGTCSVNLGKNWTTRFLGRHPELDSKFAVRLDKQRGYANNPAIFKDFFKKLFDIIAKHKILPHNILYNMDERVF